MAENDANRAGGVVAAFAVGALVGAAVALLYAPRSGKESREMLTEKGRELKTKLKGVIDEAPAFIEGKRAEVASAIHSGRDVVREELAKHMKGSDGA